MRYIFVKMINFQIEDCQATQFGQSIGNQGVSIFFRYCPRFTTLLLQTQRPVNMTCP